MAATRLFLATVLGAVVMAMPVVEERQACQSVWGQCGGINWNGATCCTSGNTCYAQNPWYYQCLPNAQVPATTTTTSSSSSTRVSSSSRSSSTVGPSSTTSRTSSSSVVTSSSSRTTTPPGSTTSPPPVGTGTATYSGNPFSGVSMWANSYYASEVLNLAVPSLTGTMATKASAVAKVPSFMWMDTRAKVPLMDSTLADIRAANRAGANPPNAGIFVVYDLPDRDCAAAASNGEYAIANGGVALYKAYIDAIRAVVVKYSDIRIILVIEPDSLANLVTNLGVAKCSGARTAYLECTDYALRQLNLPNVAMYLDAGHAGWLGWPANLSPAAQLFADVYKNAGSPRAVRGLATNVANYNGWNLTTPPPYTSPNQNYDESRFIQAFSPMLNSNGFPAHFITDTGRSGKQPTGQQEWGHWCNVIGTGFGVRPTANTGMELADAFVWIKPGGECDGTSDTSATRYDYHCGLSDALQPAPEAGSWFQAYFVQLLTNANPAF